MIDKLGIDDCLVSIMRRCKILILCFISQQIIYFCFPFHPVTWIYLLFMQSWQCSEIWLFVMLVTSIKIQYQMKSFIYEWFWTEIVSYLFKMNLVHLPFDAAEIAEHRSQVKDWFLSGEKSDVFIIFNMSRMSSHLTSICLGVLHLKSLVWQICNQVQSHFCMFS